MGQAAANTKEKSAGGGNTSGVNQLTDQVMATDLLIYAKAGVQMYARALTEASTPDVRIMLNKHLGQALANQEQVAAYVADRGWFNATDLKGQLSVDAKKAQETMELLR